MNVLKNLKVGALLLMALLPMAVGCGDAHRNDQGVSFTNFGWYEVDDGGEKKPVGYSMACLASTDDDIIGNSRATQPLWIGLQNNLAGEFIRVQRVHHSYHIYGASIQPPDTSSAVNGILLPSNPKEEGEWGESTLPANLTEGGQTDEEDGPAQKVYLPTPIITSDVSAFMSLNRQALPEPPFTMVVESYAEGVTSSGRRMYSNTGYMEFQILPESNRYCSGYVGNDTGDEE